MNPSKGVGQQAMVEVLEERRLLSASLSKGGTLYVPGTRHGDDIQISRTVDERVDVSINGIHQTFLISDAIKRIHVAAGRGDDKVSVSNSNNGLRIVREILTGQGDDTVIGGNGVDRVWGGVGDDVMDGRGGNDALNGNDGFDTLYGGNEDDDLNGGADDDTLIGGAGRDTLGGGDGDDELQGETGSDFLDGGAGDDDVNGGADVDTVYGGAGADTFHLDQDTRKQQKDEDLLEDEEVPGDLLEGGQ